MDAGRAGHVLGGSCFTVPVIPVSTDMESKVLGSIPFTTSSKPLAHANYFYGILTSDQVFLKYIKGAKEGTQAMGECLAEVEGSKGYAWQ